MDNNENIDWIINGTLENVTSNNEVLAHTLSTSQKFVEMKKS